MILAAHPFSCGWPCKNPVPLIDEVPPSTIFRTLGQSQDLIKQKAAPERAAATGRLYLIFGGASMTNEELVALIRDGHHEYMLELYRQNRGIMLRLARSYSSMLNSYVIDIDDLMQTGYIALAEAVAAYDESRGKFITILPMYLKNHMRLLGGLRLSRKAHNGAVSLDEPMPGTDGGIARIDTLIDKDAVDPCAAAELDDLRRIVRTAVGRLPDMQRKAIEDYYFHGRRYRRDHAEYDAAAAVRGRAILKLRRNKKLQQLVTASKTPIYRHVSLNTYRSSWDSAVELAAMQREEFLKQLKQLMIDNALAQQRHT